MINIPLSISLAVASGATPIQGLITGIWAGIFASFFASSHFNVYGVAGALSSILLTFVLAHGSAGIILLPALAIIAWCIILLVYAFRITKYITLIPSTALHGFLISVGITIALGQISAALGLNDPAFHIPTHKEIYLTLYEVCKHISQVNIFATLVFLWGFGFLTIGKKYFPKFPSVIVLTLLGIILGIYNSRGVFPDLLLLSEKFPTLAFSLWQNPYSWLWIESLSEAMLLIKSIFLASLVIAIIAILETIISAKIAEKITKKHFDKDREVLWLGIANIGSWLFGGLPATAVFIRTALNIKSGATHKSSAFLASIFTLGISFLLFNNFFQYLPFPIIAAILMNIAFGLIDIDLLKKLFFLEKKAFLLTLIVTFFSVIEEPTYGILIGTAITLLMYLKKVTDSDANVSIFRDHILYKKMPLQQYLHEQKKDDIILIKFSGGLSYLNTEHSIEQVEKLDQHQHILFSFSHMGEVDIDGVEAIEHMMTYLEEHDIEVYCSGLDEKHEHLMTRTETYKNLEKQWKTFSSASDGLSYLLAKK
jgi:SulP family sulfate permease